MALQALGTRVHFSVPSLLPVVLTHTHSHVRTLTHTHTPQAPTERVVDLVKVEEGLAGGGSGWEEGCSLKS